ncbi:MAG: hypothetical protein HUU20_12070, partial [Pirellulales bacterium]|nr:hypothetical protein [Pirellulales bacterium]
MSTSLLVFVVLTASPAAGAGEARNSEADRLVEQALEAELEGNNAKRRNLLAEALRAAPQCEAARWQTGQVRVGRRWMTLAESQQTAAEDPLLERYRRTLAECDGRMTPAAAQRAMARWCRQSKLPQQERFHWLKLIELSPNEPEALAALELCWHRGQLMGRDEAAEMQAVERAQHEWCDRLQELAPRLERSENSDQSAAAWERLRSISDPAAVPGLATVIAPRSRQLGLEIVALLGKMRCHEAAASLIR